MRALVSASSWLKLTSLLRVAVIMRTGTCTRPKLIEPVQIELGIETDSTRAPGGDAPVGAIRLYNAVVASRVHISVDGRELVLSNLEKVLYPDAAFTKADVIDYYRRIAPVILPHLAGRPPTLVRAPDGPDGERFFE